MTRFLVCRSYTVTEEYVVSAESEEAAIALVEQGVPEAPETYDGDYDRGADGEILYSVHHDYVWK